MKILPFLLIAVTIGVVANAQTKTNSLKPTDTKEVSCKLTTAELQERKKTVIAELKTRVLEKTETAKGMKYKFEGTDKNIDLVSDFIKTERMCCDFFDFTVSVADGNLWLELSGPEGTKDFISEEMGL